MKGNKEIKVKYDDWANDPKEHERIISQRWIVFWRGISGHLILSRAFVYWELKTFGISN